MFKALIPAVLLALSSAAYAQAPAAGDATKARTPRFDCSKASDPKACEERRSKRKAAHDQAMKACASKPEGERRDCMRAERCKASAELRWYLFSSADIKSYKRMSATAGAER